MRLTRRIYPHKFEGEGQFVALFRRRGMVEESRSFATKRKKGDVKAPKHSREEDDAMREAKKFLEENLVALPEKKLVYLNGNMTGYADETYVPTPALGHSTTEPSDNDCTTISLCDRCKSALPALDSEHKYIITAITYESYASKGVIVKNCSACASAEEKTSEAEEIIVALGYSTNGTDGIAGGYSINNEALEAYNEINPTKKITFGVVMMNPYYLKDKDTFFTSSKVVNFDDLSKGAIQISMTTTRYSTLGFSIDGFEGYLAELELIISAYIYAEGDESVEFVQDQTTKCASKRVSKDVPLYTVTLNSVVAEANNSIAALDEYDYTLPSSKERV
jgi:hypothetical protein